MGIQSNRRMEEIEIPPCGKKMNKKAEGLRSCNPVQDATTKVLIVATLMVLHRGVKLFPFALYVLIANGLWSDEDQRLRAFMLPIYRVNFPLR